jgi:geranylgeranyl diphosphate synthase, type I
MTTLETAIDPFDPSLLSRVEAQLERVLDDELARAEAIDDRLADVAAVVRSAVLSGGKRVRPAVLYWGWRGAGGDPDDPDVFAIGASLELIHAFALAHDDVMDASDTRRGQVTTHRRFEADHRAAGWDGDPARYGEAVAVLTGDLLLSWGDRCFFEIAARRAAPADARAVFDTLRVEMIWGQYLDMRAEAAGADEADALKILHLKSGHYTILRPLQLAAALTGADRDIAAAYDDYGSAVGEVFQLRDDILGVFGDPVRTGKPAGDDLKEGKRTVLVALTVERLPAGERRGFEGRFGRREATEADVERMRAAIVDSGALETVEQHIVRATDRALQAIEAVPLERHAAEALKRLALLLRDRTS